MKTIPTAACVAALLCSFASAHAAPRVTKPKVSRTYSGKPTPQRGKIDASALTLPTKIERGDAVAGDAGAGALPEAAWAIVSPRKPDASGRAALVFLMPDAVDAKRSVASWGVPAQTSGTPYPLPPGIAEALCLLVGCTGESAPGPAAPDPARALQVWVKATAGKHYAVVCRAKLEDKVGDLVVATDGFTLTAHVDHTGKSFGKVDFMLSAQQAGWYGFTLMSAEAWSTSGCTVDELD